MLLHSLLPAQREGALAWLQSCHEAQVCQLCCAGLECAVQGSAGLRAGLSCAAGAGCHEAQVRGWWKCIQRLRCGRLAQAPLVPRISFVRTTNK